MPLSIFTNRKVQVIMTIVVAFAAACHFTQQELPIDVKNSCGLTADKVNSWFESGTASLNGAVKPANSVTFPDAPNCSFYEWSEQMFLWLNSPAPPRYGSNGGLVINSPAFYDVTPEVNGERHFVPHKAGFIRPFNVRKAKFGSLGLPVVMEKRTLRLLQVLPPVLSASGRQLVMDRAGREREVGNARLDADRHPVLLDLNGKIIEQPRAILRIPQDTGFTRLHSRLRITDSTDKSVLVQKITTGKTELFLDLFGNFPEAEQAQADGGVLMAQNGSLVYYALTVNNVYALFRTKLGSSVPDNAVFPTSQAELNGISSFAAAHGQPAMIDSEALAIEIKTSWVEAKGLPDADKFIKMKAVVPTYDKSNPNEWVPNGTQTVELAMVGMHVVGSAKGHPEMLWATFEHLSNTPVAQYTYKKTGGGTNTVAQNTTGTWIFCASEATNPFNEAHIRIQGDGHIKAESGFTVSPSNIIRTKPWGLDGTNAAGNTEVMSINTMVRSVLDPADVRRNYIQTGTTWTPFGSKPTGGNSVGTDLLANTTMETFTQGNPGGCFSCHQDIHNTIPQTTTSTSHIFDVAAPLFK